MREATLVVLSSEPGRDWQEPGPSVEHVSSSGSRRCLVADGLHAEVSAAVFQGCWPFHLEHSPVVSVTFSRKRTKKHWATNRMSFRDALLTKACGDLACGFLL